MPHYQLVSADYEHQEAINNLMQLYTYDFSEYLDLDVDEKGLYKNYPHLGDYWAAHSDCWPYLIRNQQQLLGFALVKFIRSAEGGHFSIAEFFILKKYRRKHIGQSVAFELFHVHIGEWEVYQQAANKPAQLFWHTTIDAYTKGNFREFFREGKLVQRFTSKAML